MRLKAPQTQKTAEARWLKIGRIGDKLWAVGFTYREAGIRIFTVRPARKDEKDVYYGY